eukprot:6173333-Pleurochrysis_carterae.AAC.2
MRMLKKASLKSFYVRKVAQFVCVESVVDYESASSANYHAFGFNHRVGVTIIVYDLPIPPFAIKLSGTSFRKMYIISREDRFLVLGRVRKRMAQPASLAIPVSLLADVTAGKASLGSIRASLLVAWSPVRVQSSHIGWLSLGVVIVNKLTVACAVVIIMRTHHLETFEMLFRTAC